jgi:hypothetical protein
MICEGKLKEFGDKNVSLRPPGTSHEITVTEHEATLAKANVYPSELWHGV